MDDLSSADITILSIHFADLLASALENGTVRKVLKYLRMFSGLPISVETCPHYLVFASEDVPEGATQYKCAPPLRPRANQDKLWEFVMDGRINSVATDHSPSPVELKHLEEGDFSKAWGGISGDPI